MYKVIEINKTVYKAAKEKWKTIAKPLGSLGIFEEAVAQIAAIQGTLNIDVSKRCVLVMCADNGVVAEGVTQTDSSVTATVAENIARGQATVCIAAKTANADVIPVDVGVARDTIGTLNRKIAYGTKNLAREKAMTREETEKAIQTGIDLVREFSEKGYKIIITGEMGIGNTTTSSAIAALLMEKKPREVTGRGAGLSNEGLQRKIAVIEKAIALHKPDKDDIIDVLSKVGGLDIAAIAGVFIGGAMYGVPVVIDGFISSVAALCAAGLCKGSADYMIASHISRERYAEEILKMLGKTAPICAGMFPGEGAGGVMLLPLLDTAVSVFKKMPTFKKINVEQYKEFK